MSGGPWIVLGLGREPLFSKPLFELVGYFIRRHGPSQDFLPFEPNPWGLVAVS